MNARAQDKELSGHQDILDSQGSWQVWQIDQTIKERAHVTLKLNTACNSVYIEVSGNRMNLSRFQSPCKKPLFWSWMLKLNIFISGRETFKDY